MEAPGDRTAGFPEKPGELGVRRLAPASAREKRVDFLGRAARRPRDDRGVLAPGHDAGREKKELPRGGADAGEKAEYVGA